MKTKKKSTEKALHKAASRTDWPVSPKCREKAI